MPNEPLNTMPITQFLQQVKSADLGNSKEIKMEIKTAKRLAFCLGEVMTRLEGDLEKILMEQNSAENETVTLNVDGGANW